VDVTRVALGLAFAAMPLGLAAQTVKVDFDHDVDFSRYKAYSWSETQEPASNPANHLRLTRAIERELGEKGLQKDSGGTPKGAGGTPSVRIRYYSKIEKKLKASSYQEDDIWQPTNLRTRVDVSRIKQGTLILELSDGESSDVVWRGVATDVAPRPDLVAEAIDAWTKKILLQFPPPPPPPKP
jgi:hypothetical protein